MDTSKKYVIEFEGGQRVYPYWHNGKLMLWGQDITPNPSMEGKLSYGAMVKAMTDDCLVLNNNLIGVNIDSWEVKNGSDYDEETDEYDEVFQYFIIDSNAAEAFERFTDELVYYNSELDLYLLGVTHFGTSWDYVASGYEIVEVESND